MNIRTALLLTRDSAFEATVRDALVGTGAKVVMAHDVADALETSSKSSTVDLVVIDRSDCHAITLLSAVRTCRPQLPIVVVIARDSRHCAALAYAHGAASCITKPITSSDLKVILSQLCEPKLELTLA